MGRQELPIGTGMLFVFETLEAHTFWMRNTPLWLDMIFITGQPSGADASVVGIVHDAKPMSTDLRSVEQASRFVVEVPGGWAKTHSVGPGIAVHFSCD